MKRLGKIILIGLIFLASINMSNAQLPRVLLTDSARVSLLTCSPGTDLYSLFGHSAIRVEDSQLGIDWVFNYGTFDFSDPNFYPNFVRGKLNYILSVSTYKNFEYGYIFEGRKIFKQEIDLTTKEKQLLLDSLRINHFPENRYYLYDFLFDNCATRIRDIFVEVIPRTIVFDDSAVNQGQSFRQLLKPYASQKPWAMLGINLLLGVKADRIAAPWDYMFLPDHMMSAFANANFVCDTSISMISQHPVLVLDGQEFNASKNSNTPFIAFLIILIVIAVITFINYKSKTLWVWFDRLIFSIVGLLGTVIAFQWFGSDHDVMALNYNLIWAHPLYLIAVVLISVKWCQQFVKYFFGAHAVILLIISLLWFLLPQTLPLPVLPLVLGLAIRSGIIYWHKKQGAPSK
jgi:hypothetical protein